MGRYDYIIVGFGLAGLSFAEQLRRQNKSFLVISDDSQKSSRVAGGLCNPLVLKRFTLAWDARSQLNKAELFYGGLSSYLDTDIWESARLLRRFNDVEEQNNWIAAADKPELAPFLSTTFHKNSNSALDMPYHSGEVQHVRRIHLKLALDAYRTRLLQNQQILLEPFNYDALVLSKSIDYKGLKASHIVFCEGYGLMKNPYFQGLPMLGNKGEYIIIKSQLLALKTVLKAAVFMLPLGDDLYKVGATYDPKDKSADPTESARIGLEQKLKKILKVPYEVVDHIAGIRPTTRDRRPLVGTHPKYPNMHVLNGFGSRGVLLAPTMSQILYESIAEGVPIDTQVTIDRFS